MKYVSFGTPLEPGSGRESLKSAESRKLFDACRQNTAFTVLELRTVVLKGLGGGSTVDGDVIVVDCIDGTYPSMNAVGIKPRERLALVCCPDCRLPYEVRALRSDFPETLHQNHVQRGEPASLCLYFEPWDAVKRYWTPEGYLQRIQWWLRATANGTLHAGDQPLEQFYFESPYELVLPPDFLGQYSSTSHSLKLEPVVCRPSQFKAIRAQLVPREATLVRQKDVFADLLVAAVPAVRHLGVARHPGTLGELQSQLEARDSSLIQVLKDSISEGCPKEGLRLMAGQRPTLLVLIVPRLRDREGEPERTDVKGLMLDADIASIGLKTGALVRPPEGDLVFKNISIGGAAGGEHAASNEWSEIPIAMPIEVKFGVSKQFAREASGVADEDANFHGLLAGVGALGGVLAELWSHNAWGSWTYIDDDILEPHNTVRHIGKDPHIGYYKVDVVASLIRQNYAGDVESPKAIVGKLPGFGQPEISEAIKTAKLLVDATTSLHVPRDLSADDSAPRSVSVFLTPSGKSSVLLLEDCDRTTRLSHLEAQYYRAILENDWGVEHLAGHRGALVVGGGCRDISAVIPFELVQLHGAGLARQIRLLTAERKAEIRIWNYDDVIGSSYPVSVSVYRPIAQYLADWAVIWDEGLDKKLRDMRSAGLPNETGGVLLGYVDQHIKTVFVVDALPAPSDSSGDETGFTRGVSGLEAKLEECARRTADIVGYVGEWHSHPPGSSSTPSHMDVRLLAYLASCMKLDGLPVVMIIVGDDETTVLTGRGQ